MAPHLHPRSRVTTSLFGTTLLVSFLVVGMPHLFPCPAPRTQFADVEITEDGRRRRRRRSATAAEADEGAVAEEAPSEMVDEGQLLARKAHECPVPKPGGIIGEVLGFKKDDRDPAPSRTRAETLKRGPPK
ncbi:hypothetical protein MMC08_003281 [Hypocenomyce scalaris]|nr:hypothetical protein [Hypocenomyce scalaris]